MYVGLHSDGWYTHTHTHTSSKCVCININMTIAATIWKVLWCFGSLGETLRKTANACLLLDDPVSYFILVVCSPCDRDYARSKPLKDVSVKRTIVIVQVIHNSNVIASAMLSRFWDCSRTKWFFWSSDSYMKIYMKMKGQYKVQNVHFLKTPGSVFRKEWVVHVVLKTPWGRGGFPSGRVVKNSSANAGNTGSIPGLGRFRMLWSN